MSEDEMLVESGPTQDDAYQAAKNAAAQKWGEGNYMVTVYSSPSKNLSTGDVLLYSATAKHWDPAADPTMKRPD